MKIGIVAAAPSTAEALRRAAALTEHDVVWTAADVEHATRLCAQQPAELVLLDLALPGSIDATRELVARLACAVLVVAANVGADTALVFQAMGCGAIDATDAPPLDSANWRVAVLPFVAKLNAVAKRVARQRRREVDARRTVRAHGLPLVAIGASAGGPAALAALLGELPQDFPAAIVIVQHVDKQFAPDMASWLNQYSKLPVRVAEEGDRVQRGSALLASTNDHLVFKSPERLGYTVHPRAQVYRPSVDVFFHSIDAHWAGPVVGLILTGMGRDGAQGLKELRNKGCFTIAQDKATCAVYGMPQAAAPSAVEILPLGAIAARLVDHFSHASAAGG
jgi:two-component system response regulator WspF